MENGVKKTGKAGGIKAFCTRNFLVFSFELKNSQLIHVVLLVLIHNLSTKLAKLVIDFFLYFFNLVAQSEVKLEIISNLFDTMHNSGVILNADFTCDFIGT